MINETINDLINYKFFLKKGNIEIMLRKNLIGTFMEDFFSVQDDYTEIYFEMPKSEFADDYFDWVIGTIDERGRVDKKIVDMCLDAMYSKYCKLYKEYCEDNQIEINDSTWYIDGCGCLMVWDDESGCYNYEDMFLVEYYEHDDINIFDDVIFHFAEMYREKREQEEEDDWDL